MGKAPKVEMMEYGHQGAELGIKRILNKRTRSRGGEYYFWNTSVLYFLLCVVGGDHPNKEIFEHFFNSYLEHIHELSWAHDLTSTAPGCRPNSTCKSSDQALVSLHAQCQARQIKPGSLETWPRPSPSSNRAPEIDKSWPRIERGGRRPLYQRAIQTAF